MQRLNSKLLLLGIACTIAIVGCSNAGAKKVEEAAGANWVDGQVEAVEQSMNSADAKIKKLEREVADLLDEVDQRRPFKDIRRSFSAYDEIVFLSERGVIQGFSDGNFRPNQTITRRQTARMLVRELGLKAPEGYVIQATDVSPKDDAYGDLAALEDHGIMTGRDGKLMPGDGLKRSQMAIMLNRAYELTEPTKNFTFTDINESSSSYKYINTLAYNGITTEVNRAFRPNDLTTRAQFSRFMARTLDERFR